LSFVTAVCLFFIKVLQNLAINNADYCYTRLTTLQIQNYRVKYLSTKIISKCLSVCPFVRLSVCHTPLFCLNGIDVRVLNFFTSGINSPIIVVFLHQTGYQYSDGDPLTKASNARGYKKITIFEKCLTLSQK